MPQKSKEIWEVAPELHHYTDWNGLEGICSSNTMWATHYKELNDLSEIEHFKGCLIPHVTERIKDEIIKRKHINHSFAREVTKKGGALKFAKEYAGKSVNNLYQITFEGVDGPPFCEPYIVSFCNHTGDHLYEKEHGLLSQWLGYGRQERYAIVFDTRKLFRALQQDVKRYAYATHSFEEVNYDTEKLNFGAKYADVIDAIARPTFHLMVNEEELASLAGMYEKFTVATAGFKHRAFKEEREVRIFLAPHTRESERYIESKQPKLFQPTPNEIKKIHAHTELQKRHIAIFDFAECPQVPIKRIIVGPNVDQKSCEKKVLKLVKNKISVQCSKTPFKG